MARADEVSTIDAPRQRLPRRVCLVCGVRSATRLCPVCTDDLEVPPDLTPAHIRSIARDPLGAALVDRWGQYHALESITPIGRLSTDGGITIAHGAVSRRHATIAFRDGTWTIADALSSNGTLVNDAPVRSPTAIDHGARIAIGGVGLYFVQRGVTTGLTPASGIPVFAAAAPVGPREDAVGETTWVGLSTLDLHFHVVPLGGGFVEARGRRATLTTAQAALLRTLARRMLGEPEVAESVRGFIPTVALIAELPWYSTAPLDGHLKQLVRRTRQILEEAGIGCLVESRRGFGYRLRVMPGPGSTGI